MPAAERIVEILDEESTLHNCDNPEDKVNDGSIQFDNVSFSYIDDKEKECLKNINLNIPSGSTLGIIGGTGSGKSSLVQLIPRLYDVTEGSVKIGARVKKALESVDGVSGAVVSHEKNEAVVTLAKEVDDEVLKKAVEEQDYKVVAIN